jgi:hypothetical protein
MASVLTSALKGTTAAAHSAFATLASATQVSAGSAVPDVDVKISKPDQKINLSKLQGKNVVVMVPAAFSPTCSETQVPAFIEKYDQFAAKGVKDIYILSVNDIFCEFPSSSVEEVCANCIGRHERVGQVSPQRQARPSQVW